jgi:hypothetical protein
MKPGLLPLDVTAGHVHPGCRAGCGVGVTLHMQGRYLRRVCGKGDGRQGGSKRCEWQCMPPPTPSPPHPQLPSPPPPRCSTHVSVLVQSILPVTPMQTVCNNSKRIL